MEFMLDSANLAELKHGVEYYPVDGITTNPSILAKYGKPPYEALLAIREFIGNKAELHAQVVSTTAEAMVFTWAIFPMPRDANSAKIAKIHASSLLCRPSSM